MGVLLPLALAGGIFFSYSFAGLAWPVAILALWSLTLPAVRRGAAAASAAALPAAAADAADDRRARRCSRSLVTWSAPSASPHGFNKVAGSNTYGPVSPLEALGVWPASNYRLDAAGGAHLPGLAGAIGILALLAGRRLVGAAARARDPGRARRLRRPLPRLAPIQRRLLPGQGADDRRPAGDARRDPPPARRVPGRGAGDPVAGRKSTARCAGRIPCPGPCCGSAGPCWRSPSSAGRSTPASWRCGTRRSGRPGTAPSCRRSCRSSTASLSSTRARTATPPTG